MDSTEHSVKGYVDNVTILSNDIDTWVSALQTVDQRAVDLDLSFKPTKCVCPTCSIAKEWHTFIKGHH